MRRLMLLRHAKSDWAAPGARDHDRPLSTRGREAAPRMGTYMARHALVPDLIVASTAARVTETLALLLPAFKVPPKTMPDAPPATSPASSTATDQPRRATSRATVSPASPAPITQTSTSRSWLSAGRSGTATAVAAYQVLGSVIVP